MGIFIAYAIGALLGIAINVEIASPRDVDWEDAPDTPSVPDDFSLEVSD